MTEFFEIDNEYETSVRLRQASLDTGTTCRRIIADSFEHLLLIPTKSIPAIITDPPYDFNQSEKDFIHGEFLRICSGIVIVFAPPENQWILPADQYLFWIKPISTKNTVKSYSRFVEMMFVYGRHRWHFDRHWSAYTNVFTDLVDDTSTHPFRKPPSLVERLILNHTSPGDTILDPFAGSGVVGEVASRLGRNSILIDKVTVYGK